MNILTHINEYTPQVKKIIVPYFILTCLLLVYLPISWVAVFVFYMLFGIIGNGITGHRLVAHKQFKPAKWVRPFLYTACTLSGYGPVWYWRVQHLHHHKHSDDPQDIHSPNTQPLWQSFFAWTFKLKDFNAIMNSERRLLKTIMADKGLAPFTKHYYTILWGFVIALAVINPSWVLAYLIFYWIEVIRLGLTFTVSHLNIPTNYRNFDTKDSSQNNIILGYLTGGFGWHNNHHANPSTLNHQVKWWEFDAEAKLARLIEKIPGLR